MEIILNKHRVFEVSYRVITYKKFFELKHVFGEGDRPGKKMGLRCGVKNKWKWKTWWNWNLLLEIMSGKQTRLDEYKPRGISHYARKMKISKNKKLRLGKNCKCWRHASINLPSEAQYFLIKIYSSLLVYNFSVERSSYTLKKARKSNRCRSKERIQHLTPRPYNKSASIPRYRRVEI